MIILRISVIYTLVAGILCIYLLNCLIHTAIADDLNLSTISKAGQLFKVSKVPIDDVLNLRELPNANARILVSIPHDGQGIEATGRAHRTGRNTWFEVKFNKIIGWVNVYYLNRIAKANNLSLSSIPKSGQLFEVSDVLEDDVLNLRVAPNTSALILVGIPYNALDVIATGRAQRFDRSLWFEVRFDQITGWVNAHYLILPSDSNALRGVTLAKPERTSSTVSSKTIDSESDLGKRVAIVIGNGAYSIDTGMNSLPNAPNDGHDIAKSLDGLGFEVIKAIDLNLIDLETALNRFRTQAKDAKIALFFYAGHGLQVNNENYILPVDSDPRQLEDLQDNAVTLTQVMEAFKTAKPLLSVIILDACRNNPLTSVLMADATSRGLSKIKVGKGLARRSGLPGMLIAYSTEPENIAQDGIGRNSPFTTALLEQMKQPELEIRLMFGAVRDAVVKATNGAQTPFVEEAVLGRFFFKPPPKIRTKRFNGRWYQEFWMLMISDNEANFIWPAYSTEPSVFLSKAACNKVYERNYLILSVDEITKQLGNRKIESWARSTTKAKSVIVMRIVCGFGTNRYYFVLADNRQMLVAQYREQDWVMFESVYLNPL